ncbi:MAG: hypothetical protein HYZ22_17140 [Chloroflexi bacterium]|nr:hypothetical protein [Chloroflexota bacterium]
MDTLNWNWVSQVHSILVTTNQWMNMLLPWALLISMIFLNIQMLYMRFLAEQKQQKMPNIQGVFNSLSRTLYLFGISISVQLIIAMFFFIAPSVLVKNENSANLIRWAEIYIGGCGLIYFSTKRYSGYRGVITAAYHITVLLVGWLYGSWMGILFISMPLFVIFYYWLFRLALVVVPVSNPDDWKESLQRFKMLTWYVWGLQFPIWVVNKDTDRKAEDRIRGDVFRNFGTPGIIWARSNQVVGITTGTQFSRVDGPGVIFTKPYERPYEAVDLRLQIRTSLVEAISQDGIPYKARLLAVFSMDKEPWENSEYITLRVKNHLLRGANRTDRIAGNYRYSRSRVTAALSIESVKRTIKEEHSIVYWDEWVLALVEETARKELSRHSLNELWRPLGDTSDTNPLDGIAANIKNKVSDQIRSNGIKLVAARIIDFQFDSEEAKKVLNQQIDNWVSYMEQSITKTNSDADAKSEKIKKEAAAYARSNLLAAIAKGLDQVGENYENLPKKYVVAIRLIVALEDALRKPTEKQNSGDENNNGNNKKIEAFRSSIKNFNIPSE